MNAAIKVLYKKLYIFCVVRVKPKFSDDEDEDPD